MKGKWASGLVAALVTIGAAPAPSAPAPSAPALFGAVPAGAFAMTVGSGASTRSVPPAGPAPLAPLATVNTGGGTLNTRVGPSTVDRVVGSLPHGSRVSVSCQVYGQSVAGPFRRSAYWNRLANGRYLADAYLAWRPARPWVRWCGAGLPVTAAVASAGGPVNTRSGPGARHRLLGRLPNGAALTVRCQRWGERIVGPRGAAYAWNVLADGRHISAALVTWRPARPALPWCGQAPPTVPADTPAGFIARVAGPARLGARRYRVPASVTIAQAILESGWGRSGLARRDHNYFGIKCFGTPGPIALGCRTYPTHECGGGRCWRTRARFRSYRGIAGSMADHGRFLAVSPRYRAAFRFFRDPNRFAVAIHRAGYATSPRYARNLIRIMRQYTLYRFDH